MIETIIILHTSSYLYLLWPLKEPFEGTPTKLFSDPKDLLTRSWSSFATHWAGWSGDMPTFPLVLREGDARGLDCESKFYVEPGEGISTATLVLQVPYSTHTKVITVYHQNPIPGYSGPYIMWGFEGSLLGGFSCC